MGATAPLNNLVLQAGISDGAILSGAEGGGAGAAAGNVALFVLMLLVQAGKAGLKYYLAYKQAMEQHDAQALQEATQNINDWYANNQFRFQSSPMSYTNPLPIPNTPAASPYQAMARVLKTQAPPSQLGDLANLRPHQLPITNPMPTPVNYRGAMVNPADLDDLILTDLTYTGLGADPLTPQELENWDLVKDIHIPRVVQQGNLYADLLRQELAPRPIIAQTTPTQGQFRTFPQVPSQNVLKNFKAPSLSKELSVTQKILTPQEIQRIFQNLQTQYAQTSNALKKSAFKTEIQQLKAVIANNMVKGSNSLINNDRYVIIGEQAYGKEQALAIAFLDVENIIKTGRHLPSLPYPTTPNLPISKYPDVTSKVLKEIEKILTSIKIKPNLKTLNVNFDRFQEFGNNKKWDMQVGHGLPRQVIMLDQQGNIKFDPNKKRVVLTKDQYAIFRGKIVRAGYISNYVFGYVSAFGGFSKFFATTIAKVLAKDNENPLDTIAIEDGWEEAFKLIKRLENTDDPRKFRKNFYKNL